ncbi:hypothetical protein BGX38DRAFT_1267786 [Terfezia claveryi]|nr:hypothetical protein BGX38DRAFT_1267786 [Terfezia claveryi]
MEVRGSRYQRQPTTVVLKVPHLYDPPPVTPPVTSTPPIDTYHYCPSNQRYFLATEEKSTSSLINPSSLDKICLITPNIKMVYSGMGPHFRVLVDRARKVSHTNYKRIYNEYPPNRILVQGVV